MSVILYFIRWKSIKLNACTYCLGVYNWNRKIKLHSPPSQEVLKNLHCAVWPLNSMNVQKWGGKLRQKENSKSGYLRPWSQVSEVGFEVSIYSSGNIRTVSCQLGKGITKI